MMAVTVMASKSEEARLLERLYMLAATMPQVMITIPAFVPPTEKSGEKKVAMTTPRKVMIRLATSFRSALWRKKRMPRIRVMHGMVATKIALMEADVILMP